MTLILVVSTAKNYKMNDNLIQDILKYVSLTESDIATLSKYTEQIDYKKKEYVLKENSFCRHLFFVEKGCLRMYFINDKAVEQIVQFAIDGWWISDLKASTIILHQIITFKLLRIQE